MQSFAVMARTAFADSDFAVTLRRYSCGLAQGVTCPHTHCVLNQKAITTTGKPAAVIPTLCLSIKQRICKARDLTTFGCQTSIEHANSSTRSKVSLQRAVGSKVMRSARAQDSVGKGYHSPT